MTTLSHNPELLATMRAELEAVVDTCIGPQSSPSNRAVALQAMAHAAAYLIAQGRDVASAPTVEATGEQIASAVYDFGGEMAGRAGWLVALWDFETGRMRR